MIGTAQVQEKAPFSRLIRQPFDSLRVSAFGLKLGLEIQDRLLERAAVRWDWDKLCHGTVHSVTCHGCCGRPVAGN